MEGIYCEKITASEKRQEYAPLDFEGKPGDVLSACSVGGLNAGKDLGQIGVKNISLQYQFK